MATCREQHEAVPDRVVKAEALQEMKDRAERVQDAPNREQPQARAREDGCERVVRHDTAPTKQQAKNDGKAIEPPRKGELQSHADAGAQPDADAETCRSQNVLHLHQKRRVGPIAEWSKRRRTHLAGETGPMLYAAENASIVTRPMT